MKYRNRWMNVVFWALLLSVAASLLLYAYLGTFTRYMADDYCTAGALKTKGFWGAQTYWWDNWSGRYSFTFAVSLLELFGLWIVRILPAVVISLWLFSIIWASLPFLKRFKIENYILSSVFIACLLPWLTYQSVSDYPQIVFWQTGVLTYPISILFFLFGIGIAVRRTENRASISWIELVFWFLFALITAGFSETGAVIQTSVLVLLIVFVKLVKHKHGDLFNPILFAALCGSILSILIIALAPGNAVRSQGFRDIPPLGGSLLGSLIESLVFIPKLIRNHTAIFTFGFLCGVFGVYCCAPDQVRVSNLEILKYLAASLLAVEIEIGANIAPAYILRGGLPPERVLLFSFFLVACLILYWGALIGIALRMNLPSFTRALRNLILPGMLFFLIVWEVIPVMRSQLDLTASLQRYSSAWDQRHQTVITASQSNPSSVVVENITGNTDLHKLRTKLWVTGDLEDDPDYWVNRCAAEYYGVNQIIAR